MEARSWFAVLEYVGTDFAGWQRQPAARTVQGVLEDTLSGLSDGPVTVHAAGRTDAGVHARGQVVSFSLPRAFEPAELERALDALTPADLHARRIGVAPSGFHARKDATSRRYEYVIGCDRQSRSPFRRPHEWALARRLNGEALAESAALLVGEHDFRGLSSAGQVKPHYRCRVHEAAWRERSDVDGFIFSIEADRFLHRMVRFVVGLAVEVALGRRPAADMTRLLTAHDNAEASPPAPPEGLYLMAVRYPQLGEDALT